MTGYSASLEYLYGLEKSGILFGLDNISALVGLLGNPQQQFSSIHVGGTNGKGSVVCMLSKILEKAGYRTGMYTSPHLVHFNERIRINGEAIGDKEVAELTDRIRGVAVQEKGAHSFSFFDFTTAMALLYFREKGVDWAIVEVGMGGRLDSTNVIRPVVSVITNVEMDHMEYLGESITQIAQEKAGIIKEGAPVVTGASGEALQVIRKKAGDKSKVCVLGEDFSYIKADDQRLSYRGLEWDLKEVRIGLQGDHQLFNGAIVLCAAELLSQRGAALQPEKMEEALSSAQWPGRLEIAASDPVVLLDGAHNPHGARSLAAFLETHYRDKRKILVFGAMKDKNWKEMLHLLSPLVDEIILTKPDMERAANPKLLAAAAPAGIVRDNLRSALATAKEHAKKEDIIIVSGSLFIIGEAKTAINEAA
jgi:dihydrofolate synthase / folylpolyglutamate synthase